MDAEASNTKFVRFDKWCKKCKYSDQSATKDPCNDCLAVGGREGTEKPINYKEKS